jgi:hypothetical protein
VPVTAALAKLRYLGASRHDTRGTPSSHPTLVRNVSGSCAPAAYVHRSQVDVIIVPTSRGASALDGVAHLAARLGVPLVALCSGRTVGADVVERFGRALSEVLIVDVPDGYRHDRIPTRTSASRFQAASAGRRSDLGLKRNLGLLMARLHSWGKILFIDDDIGDIVDGVPVGISVEAVGRVAAQLDDYQVAGFACRDYPDNSVVCHARRLAGLPQDTFVSGSALGVNCNDQPIPFFPDQYNEDWFFFSRLAARRELAHVGNVIQAPYDPYEDPMRARREEFGDLVAEGLYELFEKQSGEMDYFRRLGAADVHYWDRYMAARRDGLRVVHRRLQIAQDAGVASAECATAACRSVEAAADQLSTVTPELCAEFLAAWEADLRDWEPATQRTRSVGDTRDVMEILDLPQWYRVNSRSDDSSLRGTARRCLGTSVAP